MPKKNLTEIISDPNGRLEQLFLERQSFYTDARSARFQRQIIHVYELMKRTFKRGHKVLIFGNGGSAAEAQHFAAELVCKFERERKALPAIALTTDSSILTAQGNDSGFGTIFSRQIEALCEKGDLAIGLTTSDAEVDSSPHSLNILNAFLAAKKLGATRVGMFGLRTSDLLGYVDAAIFSPSDNTAMIQEGHLFAIHALCTLLEDDMCTWKYSLGTFSTG